MNDGPLARYGVQAVVTGINIDAGTDTVTVMVSARLDRLFPSVVPDVVVTEVGKAEVRAYSK